jgi:hypothetical protein
MVAMALPLFYQFPIKIVINFFAQASISHFSGQDMIAESEKG